MTFYTFLFSFQFCLKSKKEPIEIIFSLPSNFLLFFSLWDHLIEHIYGSKAFEVQIFGVKAYTFRSKEQTKAWSLQTSCNAFEDVLIFTASPVHVTFSMPLIFFFGKITC